MNETIKLINQIAKEISFDIPTKEQIEYVINNYEYQTQIDPSGRKDLWIEQLLYDAGVQRIKNNK